MSVSIVNVFLSSSPRLKLIDLKTLYYYINSMPTKEAAINLALVVNLVIQRCRVAF